MTTNTLHSIAIFCKSLVIAIVLVLVNAAGTAQAQVNIPNLNDPALNGLFTPTSAQRFFEEGRNKMEREIKILTNSEHYLREDILQVDTRDIESIDELDKNQPIPDVLEDSP